MYHPHTDVHNPKHCPPPPPPQPNSPGWSIVTLDCANTDMHAHSKPLFPVKGARNRFGVRFMFTGSFLLYHNTHHSKYSWCKLTKWWLSTAIAGFKKKASAVFQPALLFFFVKKKRRKKDWVRLEEYLHNGKLSQVPHFSDPSKLSHCPHFSDQFRFCRFVDFTALIYMYQFCFCDFNFKLEWGNCVISHTFYFV